MPLIKSKSKAAFGKNVAKERSEGKSEKQSLAIAYAVKRDADDKRKPKGKKWAAIHLATTHPHKWPKRLTVLATNQKIP